MNKNGSNFVGDYRGAEYLATGFAGMAFVIALLFVRMERNTVEGWQGEDAEDYQPEH